MSITYETIWKLIMVFVIVTLLTGVYTRTILPQHLQRIHTTEKQHRYVPYPATVSSKAEVILLATARPVFHRFAAFTKATK